MLSIAKPLTHNGGEPPGGLLASHQFVQFWVIKLQALQEDHVAPLALGVQNVQQSACGTAKSFREKNTCPIACKSPGLVSSWTVPLSKVRTQCHHLLSLLSCILESRECMSKGQALYRDPVGVSFLSLRNR